MAFNEDPVLTAACLSPNLVVVVFFKGPRGRSISDPRADPLIMKGLLSGKTGLIKEWRDPSRPRDSFSVGFGEVDFRNGGEWLGPRFYLCGRFISLDESHVTYPSRLASFFFTHRGPERKGDQSEIDRKRKEKRGKGNGIEAPACLGLFFISIQVVFAITKEV